MLVDRSHRKWIIVTLILFLVSAGAYVPYHLVYSLNSPRGNTWPGIVYGSVGSALMLFAGLIGVRRKLRSWHLGRAESWLKGHIWLGLLSFPLIIFHAGFRLGGPLTIALMVLFTAVIVTGIYGLIVQHVIPRLMTVQISVETMYEQIPTYLKHLRAESAYAVSQVCGPLKPEPEGEKGKKVAQPLEGSGPLKDFYLSEVEPFLISSRGRLTSVTKRSAVFSHMRTLLPPTLHATLAQLEEACEERRQLGLQMRLHHWLHGWILVHLPLAAALLALSVVHAVTSLYY